jgi:uncharacterized protein YndB with AHSA1/START domain
VGEVRLEIERQLDLPPSIVWPALVDPELLAGWFAEVSVRGDRVELSWLDRSGTTAVRVIELRPEERLSVSTGEFGTVEATLESRVGGLRGTWTLLTLRASGPAARWELALDRLEELLHGRPVDWAAEKEKGSAHMSKENNIR